jgi:hypothetical protein
MNALADCSNKNHPQSRLSLINNQSIYLLPIQNATQIHPTPTPNQTLLGKVCRNVVNLPAVDVVDHVCDALHRLTVCEENDCRRVFQSVEMTVSELSKKTETVYSKQKTNGLT